MQEWHTYPHQPRWKSILGHICIHVVEHCTEDVHRGSLLQQRIGCFETKGISLTTAFQCRHGPTKDCDFRRNVCVNSWTPQDLQNKSRKIQENRKRGWTIQQTFKSNWNQREASQICEKLKISASHVKFRHENCENYKAEREEVAEQPWTLTRS